MTVYHVTAVPRNLLKNGLTAVEYLKKDIELSLKMGSWLDYEGLNNEFNINDRNNRDTVIMQERSEGLCLFMKTKGYPEMPGQVYIGGVFDSEKEAEDYYYSLDERMKNYYMNDDNIVVLLPLESLESIKAIEWE
jgi:hypothetical protein